MTASRAGTTTPTGAMGGILSIQEVPDATDGRSRGIARGFDLLDRLDEIQIGLLTGAFPRRRLEELRAQIRAQREKLSDHRLSQVLDEIDLRASVELAKLEFLG